MDYIFLNKLLSKNFTRFFPKTINRKLFRKYNIFFVPTNLNTLPKSFYPIATNLKKQNDLIFKYRKNKKLINQTTKKKLDKFLFNYFGKSNFSFFDIGSQSDKNFWRQFYNKVGKVDIILDDGGHTNDQQIISLTESVNNINNGGLHVVEDVHTSYLKHYGNPYKYSFVNFTKKLIDDINFTYPNLDRFNYSLNKSIYSIQYFESMVAFFVDRNLCEENTLIENNGFSSGNHDTAIDEIFFKFRKKYNILYKFKLIKKIERFFIIKSLRKNSRKLKRYFK